MNPTPSEHTVTFDTAGGSEIEEKTVESGKTVEKPADPTKEGYLFDGWYNGETAYDFSTPVTGDITLKANWAVAKTVKFDTDGGSAVDAIAVKVGATVTKPTDPTKEGFKFLGWYIGDKAYDFSTAVTEDITLTAKWAAAKKVTFNSDGGTSISAEMVLEGEKVTKPADPARTGYTFSGWYLEDKAYDFSAVVTADITLKAKWEVITYTINYVLDNGTYTGTNYKDNPSTYTVEDAITIKEPTGSTETTYFVYWYSDKECTKLAATEIKKGTTGDLTFYAKWTNKLCTVTFDSNGGSAIEAIKVIEGKKAAKPADTTNGDYALIGWYKGKDLYDFEVAVTEDMTLKAAWGFVIGKSYTFDQEYEMSKNPYNDNSVGNEVYFNLDISSISSLKEYDVFTLKCKISGLPSNGSIACQSAIDGWGWHSINAKDDGSEYSFTFVKNSTAVEGSAVSLKIPPYADLDKVDQTVTLKYSDLTISYASYDEKKSTIFTKGELKNGGYGTVEKVYVDDTFFVAHLVAGSWMKGELTLPEPIDITGKKIKVTAKVSADYVQGSSLFKLTFVTDETHQSEITSNDKGNVGWCDPLTTEYAEYTGSDIWKGFSEDKPIQDADLTNITKIIINPQSGTGDIWIKNIEFVD